MGKNKIKIIITLLIIGLIIPTIGFAREDDEVLNTYTLDEMINKALKRSPTIKSAEFTIESVDITRERANFNFTFYPSAKFSLSPEPIGIYKTHLAYNSAYENARDNLQIEIDSITYDVLKKYQGVLNSIENLNVSNTDLLYKRNLMDIAALKNNMGLTSDIERNSAQQMYNIAKRTYELKVKEMNKAYSSLNSLVGIKEDTRYKLEPSNIGDIEKEIKDSDLDYLVTLGRDGLIIKILERNLAQSQFNYDFYVFNDPREPRPLDAVGEDINAEESKIAATKDSLSEAIKNIFLNAQDIQKKYKDLLTKDGLDRKLHEIKVLQLDLGMITKIDFEDSEKKLLENEANLVALKNGFNEVIFMLNYPHVASR